MISVETVSHRRHFSSFPTTRPKDNRKPLLTTCYTLPNPNLNPNPNPNRVDECHHVTRRRPQNGSPPLPPPVQHQQSPMFLFFSFFFEEFDAKILPRKIAFNPNQRTHSIISNNDKLSK